MVEQGFTSTTLNVTITGLKFFFDVTVHHPELMARMHPVPVPRKLPQVLSRDEAARLIASAAGFGTTGSRRSTMNVAYPICSHGQRPDRRSRPMRGRFAFCFRIARWQETDHGQYDHLTLIEGILGVIDTKSAASIDLYLDTGTIQIAIAGGTS